MTDGDREIEARVRSCYAGWSTGYHDEYCGPDAPYPPVHRDLLLRLLAETGARDVLDAGCGPASFLRYLSGSGVRLSGFDLTPEMVAEARRVLGDGAEVWEGSVLEASSFQPPGDPERRFDAAVCVGVLPHVPAAADGDVIARLRGAVRPGGLVAVSARNALFGLFTLNRYSHRFFLDELIDAEALRREAEPAERAPLEAALDLLAERFRTDLPQERRGADGAPGYDEVLSRSHNPLVLRDIAADAGVRDARVLFTHFHRLPPMTGDAVPDLQRRASLEMEADPTDPRGLVMASAFLVVGRA